jgi:hypothetical protein
MAFIAAAIIGGGVLSAGAGIVGAKMSSDAAHDAADKQAESARYATDVQKQMYDQTRSDQQPWRQAGISALSQMADPYFQKNFGAADFQADPGYQFRMDQGQKALERSAAAKGGLQSGGFMKGLADYSQGLASQEYGNAYSRFKGDQNDRFNRLSTLSGLGQTATTNTNAAGQNFGAQAGNNAMSSANAQGAAGMASANAWGNAVGGVANAANSGANNWMSYTLMNKYMGGGK